MNGERKADRDMGEILCVTLRMFWCFVVCAVVMDPLLAGSLLVFVRRKRVIYPVIENVV